MREKMESSAAEETEPVVLENDEVEVLKEEQFTTYRQVIACNDQEDVPRILTEMHSTIVAGKFTGKLIMNCSQGSVNNITTEEVAKVKLAD